MQHAIRQIPSFDAGSIKLATLLETVDTPWILRGVAANWPVVQAAHQSDAALADYLLQFYQGATVGTFLAPPQAEGFYHYTDSETALNFSKQLLPLDAVIARLLQQPAEGIYVGATSVDTALPGFLAANCCELDFPSPLISLWLGNQSRIPIHQDLPLNIAYCLAGRRQVTLFAPDQLENLYIGPLELTPAGQPVSLVNLQQPDRVRFPKFAKAMQQAWGAELLPGDALFIPSMWWHHMAATAPLNLLLNYWWRPNVDRFGSPMNALIHAMLALRHLPEHEKQAWQSAFQHYVFADPAQAAAHLQPSMQGMLAELDDASVRQLRAMLINRLNR